jgi:hypothetical protein
LLELDLIRDVFHCRKIETALRAEKQAHANTQAELAATREKLLAISAAKLSSAHTSSHTSLHTTTSTHNVTNVVNVKTIEHGFAQS